MRGRDVGFSGTAAGIVRDAGETVLGIRIGVVGLGIVDFLQVLLDILVRHEDGRRVLRRGGWRRGGTAVGAVTVVIPVVVSVIVPVIIPVIPIVSAVAPLLARGLAGDRDDNFLGGLVAGEQQRQGDKEEGKQSFHGRFLFRLSQM